MLSILYSLDDVANVMEYQKVKVQGVFDYTKEVLVGPRSLLNIHKQNFGAPSGAMHHSGYHVITPFETIGNPT